MTRTRAAALIFISKSFSLGLSLVAVRFYLQWLGKESYGLFILASVAATYLTFVDLGVSSSAIQYVTDAHARGKDELALFYHRAQLALQCKVALCIAIMALCIQCLPASWLILDVPGGKEMLAILSLSTIIVSFNGAFTGIFVSKDMFQVIALRESLVTLVSTAAGMWAVWKFRTPLALGWVVAIASFLTLVFNGLLTAKMFSWRALLPVRSQVLEKKLLSYALRGYVQRISIQILRTVDRLLMPLAINLTALTDYSNGYRIPDTIHVVHVAALQPVQPHLTREATKGAIQFGSAVDRMTRIMALIGVCTLLIPSGFGYPLLKLWLGHNSPANGEWVVLFIGISMALQTYYMGLAFAIYANGKPEKLTVPIVLKSLILIAFIVPVARLWGIVGVAAFTAVLDVLQFWPFVGYLHRSFGSPFPLGKHMVKVICIFLIGLGLTVLAFLLTRTTALATHPVLSLLIMPLIAILAGLILSKTGLADLPDGIQRLLSRTGARFRQPGDRPSS